MQTKALLIGLSVLLVLVGSVSAIRAQDEVAVLEAERAIPFGVVRGHIVAVNDQFVFVEEDDVDRSFALRRDNISQASADDGLLTIRTNVPVDDTSEFTFRLDSQSAGEVVGWVLTGPATSSGPVSSGTSTASRGVAGPAEGGELGQYRVDHNHFLGECSGILMITADGVDYQSTTAADHSQRWDTADIAELERDDHTTLRIESIIGSGYDFTFTGDRLISDSDFRALSDRVARARLGSER